ncbi:MAG: hypothetical protein OXE58_03385 [Acidobacteria bacterium]|nr:hypothetical protein [Acidobacteriota bacterium]
MKDERKKEFKQIPVGDAARKAMNLEETVLQLFPPVSPMSYGSSPPWGAGQKRPEKQVPRRVHPAHSGLL